MLKNLQLNGKNIPVPVPIKNIDEAVKWIGSTLLKNDEILTKIVVNKKEIDFNDSKKLKNHSLSKESVVQFQVDSPREISVQTLDTIRDLSLEIEKQLNFVAVKCWQLPEKQHVEQLKQIAVDLELIFSMVEHLNVLVDYTHADTAAVNALCLLIKRVHIRLNKHINAEDYRGCARILVNQLDGLLKELAIESEALEYRLFSAEASSEAMPESNLHLTT